MKKSLKIIIALSNYKLFFFAILPSVDILFNFLLTILNKYDNIVLYKHV